MKKNEQSNIHSPMEFINSLNKYIPSLVLSQWIQKADENKLQLPEIQGLETVVLFADISGFTMISEACASMGVRGNEELAFCINRYMEGMVKALGKYGGDIIKFVGDAMIVMWPRISYTLNEKGGKDGSVSPAKTGGGVLVGGSKEQQDDKVSIVRKAIQCAIDIQTELNNKKIMSNVTNLSVKIGIGFGDCALLYVGGVFNRAEFFTVGDALTQALKSEECATGGGQIIVSQKAWQCAQDFFSSEEITNEQGQKFYKVSGMNVGIRTRADAVLLRNLVQQDTYSKIQNKLKACVPAAIMPYLEIGYEQYGSETRRLSVMFASLGVDLSSAQTKVGMDKIQRIVTTVQQQVYRLEGSVNKLVMDDKGSTLICIWGLSPFAHEDDAARAILTAMNMRRELAKIENTWCNVGISTGEVFSGVVGTSGSRKEFSVLGDFVNLAARIMYWPKKYKQTGKIYVDLQTKKEADNFIKFSYHGHCEFKGKSISIPIFEPLDPQDEASSQIKKLKSHDCFLKIHSNPFLVDKNSDYKRKLCRQIGREEMLYRVCDDIVEFFDKDTKNNAPYVLAILGEPGSGKTLFMRCVIEQLKKRKDFVKDEYMGQDYLPILTSSLNAESQMKFMNIWRPILQMMLIIHCKRNNIKPERAIRRLLKQSQQDKLDIICDIFNIPALPTGVPQQTPIEDPLQFVKRERYSEDIADGILDYMIEFIKEVLGEKEEYYSEIDNPSQQDQSLSQMTAYNPNTEPCPLVLVFDTVYFMDETSWKLLDLVRDECSRIAIILLVQTDTNNLPKIHIESKTFYQETFGSHLDDINIIDMPPFKIEELSALLVDLSSKYQSSMLEEIHLMTSIDDPAHSIRNPEQSKKKEKEFKDKYQVKDTFSSVSLEVLEVALQRCEGNPLVSLNFIFNMLTNGYLQIKDYQLQGSESFKKCVTRCDWATVPVPAFTSKINSTLLDSFLKEMRSKQNKVDCENGIKGLLLLKSASVIGDVFGSKALQHISPLRNESHKSIVAILKLLESKDFIEILDETDQKNAICRFRKCFLRETIYQIMLYRDQKKGLHQLTSQFIQNNPNSMDNDPDVEAEKLLNHILISEDLDSEEKVPFKAKQGLIVKKIANKLMKAPNQIIKSGYLTKQGNKPNKKITKRLMILRAKDMSWYHNESEFRKGHPLGVVYLTAAYHCVPANRYKNTADINIGTCAWRKKNQEKEGKREFIFGAHDEMERDEWISSIEYLRTKAVYDNFVQKYCNISFPLRKNSEDHKQDDREVVLSQMQDFGNKFKGQARFVKLSPGTSPKPSDRNSKRSSRITKLGSFAQYQMQELEKQNSLIGYNNPKEIAQKIKKLYNINMVSFISQVTQNSSKPPNPNQRLDSIKKLPDYLKTSSLFSNEGDGTTSEANYKDKPSSSYSILSEEMHSEERYRRRVSEYTRKEVLDDNFDVKTYISETKAGGAGSSNSPGGVSDMKITEENEDESSGSNKSSPLGKSSKRDKSHNLIKTSAVLGGFTQLAQSAQKNNVLETSRDTSGFSKGSKSHRLSKQLILQPKKEREMTFSKQQQIEKKEDEMLFSLNINPTQVGNSPTKNANKKKRNLLDQIDQIEEQEEVKDDISPRRRKKNSNRKMNFQQIIDLEQSSETSDHNVSKAIIDIKQQMNSRKANRETGKFTQNLVTEIDLLLEEEKDIHSSKTEGVSLSRVFTLNSQKQQQQNSSKKDSIQALTNESLQRLDREAKSRNEDKSQINYVNLISQTIQDSLAKSFNQLFPKNVKQQHQQQQHTTNPHQNLQIRSNLSVISDYSHLPKMSQRSGGAASSKKIVMEQVTSKQSTTNIQFPKRGKIEEDEDDIIQDPENDIEEDEHISRMRRQQKIQVHSAIQMSKNPLMKQSQDQQLSPQPFMPTQNGYFQPPQYMYSPYQQYPSQFDQNQMYMTPPYMFTPPPYNPYFDPMMMPNQHVSQFPGSGSPHEDMDDYDPYQNNYISDIQSVAGDDQPQYAVVLEDIQCQVKGDLMQLYEGDQVEVLKTIPDMDLAQCKYSNQVGLFPMNMLKMIKRNRVQSKMSSLSQTRIPLVNQQSHSPSIKLKKNSFLSNNNLPSQNKSPSTQRASQQSKVSTQPTFYQDIEQHQQQRSRTNFFLEKSNQLSQSQQIKNTNAWQQSTIQSVNNNNNKQVQNLKLNERKQQRLEKREKMKKSNQSNNLNDESEAALIAALNF